MLSVRSFDAIRPRCEMVEAVAALPYDVMNEEEAREMADGLPYSFLRISRPEIEFARGVDGKSEMVYKRSHDNLQKFIDDGVMQVDAEPHIYLYRLIMGEHAQTGIVACMHIDDYIEGRIRKHELTRLDKELDRTRHVRTVGAHTGPVFLAYRDDAAIATQMDIDTKTQPIYDFVTGDGVRHTVWQSQDAAFYERAFEAHDACYIADGHHRAASAVRVGSDLRNEAADPKADAPFLHFLAVLFPASSLNILAYNRVLDDREQRSTDEILDCLRGVGSLEKTEQKVPTKAGEFCVYIAKSWYLFVLDPTTIDWTDPIASLDASLLQNRVLQPIFGIGDPRTDEKIDFVGGIRGTKGLEARVDSGERRLAFSMYPTQMEQIFKVSDAGKIMPPKSTWFEPKLRSGLFVHRLF